MTLLSGIYRSLKEINRFFLLTFLVFGLLNLAIVVINHFFFRTVALDYAVYNFAFYDYAHFRISPCPAYIYPFPATFFQDHFSLTLLLLSPLYWIMSPVTGTYSLLVIQWAFIMGGGWAIYKLIAMKSGSEVLAICAFIYYFVMLGRYNAYRGDVNLAIIGSSFLPFFFYYFESRRLAATLISFVLLIVNREDYALWLTFICLFLSIVHWRTKPQRTLALILTVVSVIFFILIFTVIFPAIEDENKKFALFNFSVVGETPKAALTFILTHPLKAIEFLFINHSDQDYYNGIKKEFYTVYLVSGGFILLLRPYYLIPFIPLIAKKMYDDNPVRWSIENYYSIEVVSLLPISVFSIISGWKWQKVKLPLGILICILSSAMTCYRLFVPVQNPLHSDNIKCNFLSPKFYTPECDVRAMNRTLSKVPKDAAVCGTTRIIPHLSYREKVYYFPRINDSEYICLYLNNDTYPLMPDDFEKEVAKLLSDSTWKLEERTKEVILLKRK